MPTSAEGDHELQEIAKNEFGRSYEELSTEEKRHCAGKKGSAHRWQGHEGGGGAGQESHEAGQAAGHTEAAHETSHATAGAGDEELEAIAQKDYGKSYASLTTEEKRHCAGRKGQAHRHHQKVQE